MIDKDLLQSLFHFSFSGFPAVRRQVRRPREQILQKSAILVIQMLGDLREKMFKIIIRFQTIGFRCFCNAIDYGAGLCPCDRIDHHPVLLTNAESPDRLLGGIIVHGTSPSSRNTFRYLSWWMEYWKPSQVLLFCGTLGRFSFIHTK